MLDEDQDQDAKTEEPSQKKLEEATQKGQVVNSKEVNSFAMLLLLTIVMAWIIPNIAMSLLHYLQSFIDHAGTAAVDHGALGELLSTLAKQILLYLSPILITVVVAVLFAAYVQFGEFIFTSETIQPKLSKISLIKGMQRIFSKKSLVEFLKGIVKVTLIGMFVLFAILGDIKPITLYQEFSTIQIISHMYNMMIHVLVLVTIIMAVIAAIDYAYQRYEHYNELKMTKQEVKEEYKQTEGSPEIKQRIRSLMRSQAKNRVKSTVPKATVVITNPEHYAVALRYEINDLTAPICIAKGTDLIAQTIKSIAKEHNVPIVENPPLARSLYKEVKIDQEIPFAHFEEVAKIISYVMSLDNKHKKHKKQQDKKT